MLLTETQYLATMTTSRQIDIDQQDASLRAYIVFMQTAKAALKHADTTLYQKARLSLSKLVILVALSDHGGVMSPSELADWTQTEQHNITTLVSRMKKDGLVTSERDKDNKRFVRVILTNKGRDLLDEVTPVAREMIDQVMSSVTEADAVLLEDKLRVLQQNIHGAFRHNTYPIKSWFR